MNVLHPTRVAIIEQLAGGERMSPNELSKAIGVSLGSTAYHVRTLEREGVIRLVGEERVRGAVEHFYKLDGRRRARVVKEMTEVARLTREALEKLAAA